MSKKEARFRAEVRARLEASRLQKANLKGPAERLWSGPPFWRSVTGRAAGEVIALVVRADCNS